MTTYTDIPDTSIDPESPVTTSLMTRLRDNPVAITEGSSGAPRIQAAAIDSIPAVTQSDLNTTSGTVSVSVSDGGSASDVALRALPGGQYGFAPEIRATFSPDAAGKSAGGVVSVAGASVSLDTGSGATELTISGRTTIAYTPGAILWAGLSTSGGTATATARQRYVQASPPYTLGHGDIGFFVFAHQRPNGTVGGYYIAEDPPWANNGPTDIRPDLIKNGKKYKRCLLCALTEADVREGRADVADFIAAWEEATVELVEITPETKNADMALHPHSWVEPPEGRIVLLDPLDPIMDKLRELNAAGADVAALLPSLDIGSDTDANSPPGVTTVYIKRRSRRG